MRKSGFDFDRAMESTTSREFDELITIEMHGYKTVGQYHRDISSVHVLHNIKVPVF
jgi:predicted alpha/beta-fold hydrolase